MDRRICSSTTRRSPATASSRLPRAPRSSSRANWARRGRRRRTSSRSP